MTQSEPIHIVSLGAGVQSSTMALMFAKGELTPMPDGAIFADTGAEPQYVYDWLDWLETQLPFPVHRVMHKEGLQESITENLEAGKFVSVPFFTESISGGGLLRRQCTREFKLKPLTRKIRELVGLKYRQKAPKKILAVSYIGISLDESIRMKPSREHWIKHEWPLVDNRMRRLDCLAWMQKNGYPEPGRSACTFCPYHSDSEWSDLKNNHPEDFQSAVKIDEMIRDGVRGTKEKLYLHRSHVPLTEADFATPEDRGQLTMFNDECEGMCGV
jgi:hypothetical protein